MSSSRVSTVRLRTFSPVARSSRRARSANASMPIATSMLVGGAQLLARVDAAALAAQPLAVEQVGAGELGAQPRAAQALDRLAIQALGGLAFAQQRARAGRDPQRPVGVGGTASPPRDARAARARSRRVLAPGRGLDQLAQRPGRDEQLGRVVAGVLCRRQRLVVAAETVEQDRACPVCVLDGGPLAPGGGLVDRGVDQLGGLGLRGPEGRRARVRRRARPARPGRLRDAVGLGDQRAPRVPKSPRQRDGLGEHVDARRRARASAPASRASWTPRVATARQVS